MLFPYRDDNPHTTKPVLVVAVIAANTLIFLYQFMLGEANEIFVRAAGAIPLEITRGADLIGPADPPALLPPPFTILSAMFLHGGFLHLAGNMWYLWIFGDNLEHAMGRPRFIVFYLLSGIAAALTHVWWEPNSAIPMIGASGAIAGVLGGYALMWPHARIRCFLVLFIFIQQVLLPAWLVLGFWFLIQFTSLFQGQSGVAWLAHIGGFIAGLAMVRFFSKHRTGRRYRFE